MWSVMIFGGFSAMGILTGRANAIPGEVIYEGNTAMQDTDNEECDGGAVTCGLTSDDAYSEPINIGFPFNLNQRKTI